MKTCVLKQTTTQWKQVGPIVKKALPVKLISGRPRQDDRNILNGILWICRTGAPWKDLPGRIRSNLSSPISGMGESGHLDENFNKTGH